MSRTTFFEVRILDAKTKEQLCFLDKEKSLRDEEVLQNLPVGTTATMFFRDLGPQLGWTMVFLAECIGPLLTYLLFYFRVPCIYSHEYALTSSPHPVVRRAFACHTFHYMKRLIETIFVHRFSHGTLPLGTIVRMTIWAKGKHRAYSREFKHYPSLRMAIIPLIL
ncbi:Very-long-chain enoyl-CoA reductase [Liparis tanakae]|uniref:Very-long-chain enoyl-CoA reductase n=1 Tax=Liparis tanakae TaxID=230148 RepID=A0A4Z2HHX7_9TELE|nr:Very-long-chain enoyl-CoA reductase [Liparis tanakae]